MSAVEDERTRVAREVVELGEELFELALQGYARPAGEDASEDAEAYPVEELREAASAFLRVLRGLLDV
jgi:hypothetical protein